MCIAERNLFNFSMSRSASGGQPIYFIVLCATKSKFYSDQTRILRSGHGDVTY